MKKKTTDLSRGEKILLFMYVKGDGQMKRYVYEDLVVGLFREYPEIFHLKGFTEYPDSSDSSQRLLYAFKKKGLVTVSNKIFSLTDNGLEFAQKLVARKSNAVIQAPTARLSRATAVETGRIKNLEGFVLYVSGRAGQLTESDFYNYLGVTAKTSASAFSGRMKNIETFVNEIRENRNDPLLAKINEYHEFLMSKYKNSADYFLKK